MKNDSPKNSHCDFAPEIVDLLYGEMSAERKKAFDLHLTECLICAAEIDQFSDIRFAIRDWKASEFDLLSTPEIQIPYETASIKTVGAEKAGSRFAFLRSYFKYSPVLSGATAVLALAFLFGAGVFFFGETGDELLAGSNTQPDLNVNAPVKTKPAVDEKQEKTVSVINEGEMADADSTGGIPDARQAQNKTPKAEVSRPPVQIVNKPGAKTKSQPIRAAGKKPVNPEPVNEDKNSKPGANRNRPRLNELPEEDEDDSLRLADLFAEIDTKE